MLRQSKEERTLKGNLLLASSTAFVSGVTNIAGMVAFLAFTSNITGHVANLAKHIVEQNFREIIVFVIWLLLFFTGAFVSNFIIRSLEHKSRYRAHSIPIIIEIVLLLFVAIYGHNFYKETDLEREIVIGVLIFSMGLQNSLVSTISGGLIKSTHLTGLFTDLGGDVSEWMHPKVQKTEIIRNKILVRLTVLSFYFIGAVLGGLLFDLYDFAIFYFIPLILLTILYYDLSPVALHKISRVFWADKGKLV
ncbi:YoaK family protein [Mucilaginibacter pineti]|nr:YoaK family protein [Mucilaginibacter pineti]